MAQFRLIVSVLFACVEEEKCSFIVANSITRTDGFHIELHPMMIVVVVVVVVVVELVCSMSTTQEWIVAIDIGVVSL